MSNFLIFTIILGVVAGFIQIVGYLYYIKKINISRVQPNVASWGIWSFGSVLESTSYIFITSDWVKNLLPAVCTISAIILFFYCLKYKHFFWPTLFEWLLVFIDSIAILIWWWYSSAVYANLFLVLTAFISFIPIIIHVWSDPMVEDAFPWFIWTVAYSVLAVVVIMRWEKWEDLVYPVVFAILHVIISILALDKRVPRTLKFTNTSSI